MNQLDPINVSVAVASLAFGPVLAAVIGPYSVIIIASSVGAAWSLGRRESLSKIGAGFYFLRLILTAMLITVSIASVIGDWLNHDDSSWMLAPIALLVGGVGDDWPKLVSWGFKWAVGLFERRGGGGV